MGSSKQYQREERGLPGLVGFSAPAPLPPWDMIRMVKDVMNEGSPVVEETSARGR